MKKTAIAIWGHAQQGKSSTIKVIAKLILDSFPNAIINQKTIDFNIDIKVIITIGDVKIGIESQGDPNSRLFQSLNDFTAVDCDIIICSTRTSGATVNAVSDLNGAHDYDIVWATNYRSFEKNQTRLNEISAKQIFELLREILDNKL